MNQKRNLLVMFILVLLSSLVFPVSASELTSNDIKNPLDNISIYESEVYKELISIPYGSEQNEIGFIEGGNETLSNGPTSFFVRDGEFYILDNVNKKVIVVNEGSSIREFLVKELQFGIDIFVSNNKEIFILDNSSRAVHQYSLEGKYIYSHPIPNELIIPTALSVDYNGNILVRQSTDYIVTLDGKVSINNLSFENSKTQTKPLIVNDKLGRILVQDDETSYSIDVNYDHSFGELIMKAVLSNQIVYERTEVAPNVYTIMAESFIEVGDKNGKLLGAARIPLEKMIFVPNQISRVDNNHIYLLSAEENNLVIYDVLVGKNFEKRLAKRIANYTPPSDLILTPQEFEQSDFQNDDSRLNSSLIKNSYIYRGEASSRANQMINYTWKVVNGNKNEKTGTQLPLYVNNSKVGDTLTGLPYTYGGGDGVDASVPGRQLFSFYQTSGNQTGNIKTKSEMSVTGVDCSGFVGLAWYRVDAKYGTTTLGNISYNIQKNQLKLMDALNAPGWHTVLYVGQTPDLVYTKEATADGDGKAQNYTRSWKWLDGENSKKQAYTPIRYNKILDEGTPRPEPTSVD